MTREQFEGLKRLAAHRNRIQQRIDSGQLSPEELAVDQRLRDRIEDFLRLRLEQERWECDRLKKTAQYLRLKIQQKEQQKGGFLKLLSDAFGTISVLIVLSKIGDKLFERRE